MTYDFGHVLHTFEYYVAMQVRCLLANGLFRFMQMWSIAKVSDPPSWRASR